VGGSVVLALASLVLIFGGAVAARFAGGADSEVGFRILIWRDTLALIHALPWCGAGLGNFRVFFPLFRHASINQQTVLHPESDWLLLVAEMGWLAVPLALGAIGSMLRGALPLTDGSHRRLRAAALAAALAAMLHAIVDVPEHRVGSALVALFALVLARRDTPPTADSRGVVILSRLAGLAALVVAVLLWRLPDDAGRAEQLSQAERYADSEAAANRALARAPLDWRVYFTRAGERASRGLILEAVADFRRARTLEPTYAQIPLDEGLFWRTVQPGLALDAWSEAVHRLLPPEDEDIYNVILNEAPDSPPFREQLLKMAHGRPALQLRWFQFVPAAEARAHLEEIAAVSAQFSPAQSDAFEHRMRELSAPAPP
jgi:tetratricopeptide (TPR) repeat protein